LTKKNQTLQATLSQVPEVQASIVTLNAKNGEIIAMVGGYDYSTSKFNNATQGLRQTGSAYKPFIYTAAVEWGMTPETMVSGAPIKRGGWMPKNYDGSHSHGNVPMKIALAKSLNIAAGASARSGRHSNRSADGAPFRHHQSDGSESSVGTRRFEASLLEMTAAYSSLPNKGRACRAAFDSQSLQPRRQPA
jgi:penicillin-binding protein 1A